MNTDQNNTQNKQRTYEQEKLAREQEKVSKERSEKTSKIIRQISIWTSAVVGLGLVVWGIVFLVQHYEPPRTADGNLAIENPITSEDWVKGNPNAKVVITEYSDLQCPACAYYNPIVNKLITDMGKDIAVVYRHFPLPMHANSKAAALAAEAAGKQGKFWEMHDMLFENQAKWETLGDIEKTVVGYAKTLGLNTATFEKDYNSSELQDKIDAAVVEGNRIGISYTPTFFLNGVRIDNPAGYDAFKAVIDQELQNGSVNTTEKGTSTTVYKTNVTQ